MFYVLVMTALDGWYDDSNTLEGIERTAQMYIFIKN